MPRGRKKSYKGGHRHFTSEDDMEAAAEKERKEREWRHMKGIESDEEVVEADKEGADKSTEKKKTVVRTGEPGELPPEDSDDGSDSEQEEDKPKGVSHLIEIENPNRMKPKAKKISDLNVETTPGGGGGGGGAAKADGDDVDTPTASTGLSRREREEIEKQAAKERYEKAHLAGKTDEARADLARLALIKKQREDAAKKREEERKALEDAKKSNKTPANKSAAS